VIGTLGTADFRIPSGQTVTVDARALGEVRSVHLLDESCGDVVGIPFGSPSDEFSLEHTVVVSSDGLGVAVSELAASAPAAARDESCPP
jgi:hypothetical protein